MKTNKLKSPTIYIQAVIALLIIQLVHKIVREIPGAIRLGGSGKIAVPIFAGLLVISIILLILRNKWGLILGMINGIYMLLQPILVHVIQAHPDQNGIWWYPIFPWTQAILIIYFSLLVFRNENNELLSLLDIFLTNAILFFASNYFLNYQKMLSLLDKQFPFHNLLFLHK